MRLRHNLSLPGDVIDVVIRAKTKLEIQCLSVVSCSNILALIACNLLMLGGLLYKVRLGRRDALTSAKAKPPAAQHDHFGDHQEVHRQGISPNARCLGIKKRRKEGEERDDRESETHRR